MVLGSTQPLTEMSARNTSLGDKGGRWVGLTDLPPSYADYLDILGPSTSWNSQACPGLYRDCFTFNISHKH